MTEPSSTNPGGSRELMKLAWPLILSSSFWTIQITIDRVLLSRYDSDAVAAAMMTAMLFWTPFILLQTAAGYVTTFVAQYLGANRHHRIGPAVWQGIYFSILAGCGFLLLWPLAPSIINLIGHTESIQGMEVIYFRCLCWVALPALITAALSGFFAGRGDSWTVMLLNGMGMVVNGVLDWLWIFGKAGFPEMGIEGAGWATVAGAWASALLGLALFWRKKFRLEYDTLLGWHFERGLFKRLVRYGVPAGMHWFLEMSAFTVFFVFIGLYGNVEFTASSIAFTINMVAFLPMLGVGQAVSILVGQRLGEDKPELAERSTWTGLKIAWCYMSTIALLYAFVPSIFIAPFQGDGDPSHWAAIAALTKWLLLFVAIYSVFDSNNLIFAFGLRGAGDTFFVSAVALILSWPVMVIPAVVAWAYNWSLYWPWTFLSLYVIGMGGILLWRFWTGKWKSMRVIEPVVTEEEAALSELEGALASGENSAPEIAAERATV